MIPQVVLRATLSSIFIAAAALGGLGCDDCTPTRQVLTDHEVTGQLDYQSPGVAPTTGELAQFSGFEVGYGSADLTSKSFTFTFAVAAPSRSAVFYTARLVVPSAPAGASDLELNDEVASLTIHTASGEAVFHGLTGHLHWVDSTCQTNCPLKLRGTVTLSATGPNQEVFEVTSGAFVADDSFREVRVCQG